MSEVVNSSCNAAIFGQGSHGALMSRPLTPSLFCDNKNSTRPRTFSSLAVLSCDILAADSNSFRPVDFSPRARLPRSFLRKMAGRDGVDVRRALPLGSQYLDEANDASLGYAMGGKFGRVLVAPPPEKQITLVRLMDFLSSG